MAQKQEKNKVEKTAVEKSSSSVRKKSVTKKQIDQKGQKSQAKSSSLKNVTSPATKKTKNSSLQTSKKKSTRSGVSSKTTVKVITKAKESSNHLKKIESSSKKVLSSEEKNIKSSSLKKEPSSIKSSTKSKEKALKKSRQANSNKKESKTKKKNPSEKEQPKLKKLIQKTPKKEKRTAVYISPSQLEKQNKRKFPWELILVLFILSSIGFGGFLLSSKFHNKGGSVNRTNSYDILNAVALDQTDAVSVGNSNFKHSQENTYVKETAKAKIMKISTSGELIFEKVYDSKKTSVFNSVVVIPDGYLAVGSMASDLKDGRGGQLGILVKYDKDGNLLWEKTYESSGNVQFLKIQVIEDGYLVVGSSMITSKKNDSFDGGALLFKYDFDGNLLWQQFYGNLERARFNSLVIADNAIYVVGKTEDDIGILARYSMDGALVWDRAYSYTDELGFVDIILKDQSLFVVGSKKILPNSLENPSRNTNNTDAVLIKYDFSGEIIFEKIFGGSNQEGYVSLTSDYNYLFVVGYSNSMDSGLKIFTDGKKKTGILIKYDLDGDIEKKAIFGGSNNDTMTGIVTDNRNLYMTCSSNSKDGNILSEFDNGKDSFGKLIKVDSRLRTLFVK